MSNEQVNNVAEPKENKIFDSKDLENKSHEEQILHLDGALAHLGLLSEDVSNAVAQSEFERSGKQGVIDQSSLFDKAGLGIKKFLRGQEGYDEKLSDMARKVSDKSLVNLEKGLGSQLLEAKEKLVKHESAAQNDLEAVKDLMDPKQFSAIESKMNQEKDLLVSDKNQKENELQKKLAEFPAEQKSEKIDNLLGEYGEIESAISNKRSNLENEISKYHTAFNKIKGEGATSQEIKESLKSKIETLSKQSVEMKNKEKAVKDRIDSLKKNQKELEPYVKRLQSVGKTKAEIIEDSLARLNKNTEAKDKQANGNGTETATATAETSKANPEKQTAANPDSNVLKNEKDEFQEKLGQTIMTPRRWSTLIKQESRSLVGPEIRQAFQGKFAPASKEINGVEAHKFLTEYLQKNKKRNAELNANEIMERILNK